MKKVIYVPPYDKLTKQGNLVFPDDDQCPVRDVIKHLSGKWAMLILFVLSEGPERFLELHRRIEGISKRVLTVTLRNLERNGFVTRVALDEAPNWVQYQLTEMGTSVVNPLAELVLWAQKNHDDIRECRSNYDEAAV